MNDKLKAMMKALELDGIALGGKEGEEVNGRCSKCGAECSACNDSDD